MVEIRPIRKDDLPKLLWNKEQQKWKELDVEHFQQMLTGALLWYIAESNNEVVGRVKVLLKGQTGKPTIFALRVRDDWQEQGIGTLLVQAAEHGVIERGITRVLLCVEKTEDSLKNWYERMGYTVTGERTDK
jgi:ribosomal protein S18 acetylase RimI-like enzyme